MFNHSVHPLPPRPCGRYPDEPPAWLDLCLALAIGLVPAIGLIAIAAAVAP